MIGQQHVAAILGRPTEWQVVARIPVLRNLQARLTAFGIKRIRLEHPEASV